MRGLKRELAEREYRESSKRALGKTSNKQASRQASKQGSRHALGVHSVGAMPWRGLLTIAIGSNSALNVKTAHL